jgi:hypothetical protein
MARSWSKRRALTLSRCHGVAEVIECRSPSQWRRELTCVGGRLGANMCITTMGTIRSRAMIPAGRRRVT